MLEKDVIRIFVDLKFTDLQIQMIQKFMKEKQINFINELKFIDLNWRLEAKVCIFTE